MALPYIAMGYRMFKHTYLSHFAPYFLLLGRHPIPPSSIVAQMDQAVDLDSQATWVRVIAERAALLRRVMPMAMENLSIAERAALLRRVMPMAMENLSIAQHRNLTVCTHTGWRSQT